MLNIALDGPAGAGKSTIAKKIASQFNILYLDTGAMYRATALKALKLGINSLNEKMVESFIHDIDLEIKYKNGSQVTYLDGNDVSEEIRKPTISMLASNISSLKCVRLKMVELQREFASKIDCVLDGRDIGSFVLPKTKFKFYIDADSLIRAERRFKELTEKGYNVKLEELHEEILKRDTNDKSRDFAPLVKAIDAIVIDTSHLTIDEVCNKIISIIKMEK